MKKFGWASIFSGSVIDSCLILSRASEEFEISFRRQFLTGVERVDDQAHQLLNVGIRLRHGARKLGNMIRWDVNKTCT